MDTQRRGGRHSGPVFCAIPAAGTTDGITGVPIASGPVSGVVLSVVLAALVLVTWWLMRRWSTTASSPVVEDRRLWWESDNRVAPAPREVIFDDGRLISRGG